MATRAYRAAILVLGAMALAGQTVQLDSIFVDGLGVLGRGGPTHPALASVLAVDALLTLVMVALALLLAFHPEARAGSLPLGLTVAVWSYLLAYSGIITLIRPGSGSPFRLLFQTHFLMVEMAGLAALLRFSALYPRSLAPGDIPTPHRHRPGTGLLQAVLRWFARPSAPWIAAAATTVAALVVNGLLGKPPSEAALLILVDVVRFAALSVVVLNLRRSYLLASDADREPAQWLATGFAALVGSLAVLMGANVLTTVTGWRVGYLNWRPLLLDLGLLGFLMGIGCAVLYRGELRSAAVGRQVVLLSVALMVALLLGSGLEALFSDALLARLDLPTGVGTVLGLIAVGLLYRRFRDPVERALADALHPPGPDPATDAVASEG